MIARWLVKLVAPMTFDAVAIYANTGSPSRALLDAACLELGLTVEIEEQVDGFGPRRGREVDAGRKPW